MSFLLPLYRQSSASLPHPSAQPFQSPALPTIILRRLRPEEEFTPRIQALRFYPYPLINFHISRLRSLAGRWNRRLCCARRPIPTMRSPTSRSTLSLIDLGILFALFSLRVSAACFYPNGAADNTGKYAPCKTSGQSMCCATNEIAGSSDTCSSDGFCIPPDNNGIWRGLCTDQTWKDLACINPCTTGTGVPSHLRGDLSVRLLTSILRC